jgi:hypothetical protein
VGFCYFYCTFEGDLFGGDLMDCFTGDFCFEGRAFCFPFWGDCDCFSLSGCTFLVGVFG